MEGYLTRPLEFVVETVFFLYILAVMLRFLLQWVRADFFNEFSQFLVRITQPVLRPMRRFIPGIAGIDVSSLVLAVILQALLLTLLSLINGRVPDPVAIAVITPIELVQLVFYIYIGAVLIQAVLSWVNPYQHHPLQTVLYSLTEPIIRPIRQVLPPIGGLDLSPMAAIVILYVLMMLVMPPLRAVAASVV
jgi:YggT family protein